MQNKHEKKRTYFLQDQTYPSLLCLFKKKIHPSKYLICLHLGGWRILLLVPRYGSHSLSLEQLASPPFTCTTLKLAMDTSGRYTCTMLHIVCISSFPTYIEFCYLHNQYKCWWSSWVTGNPTYHFVHGPPHGTIHAGSQPGL